jgi:hypothetical protein
MSIITIQATLTEYPYRRGVTIDSDRDTITIDGVLFSMETLFWMSRSINEGRVYKFFKEQNGEIRIHDLTGLLTPAKSTE